MNDMELEKLSRLAEEYGLCAEELLEEFGSESFVPAICMNDGCEYTTEYEPDQREGWCGRCSTGSVTSALILAGMI